MSAEAAGTALRVSVEGGGCSGSNTVTIWSATPQPPTMWSFARRSHRADRPRVARISWAARRSISSTTLSASASRSVTRLRRLLWLRHELLHLTPGTRPTLAARAGPGIIRSAYHRDKRGEWPGLRQPANGFSAHADRHLEHQRRQGTHRQSASIGFATLRRTCLPAGDQVRRRGVPGGPDRGTRLQFRPSMARKASTASPSSPSIRSRTCKSACLAIDGDLHARFLSGLFATAEGAVRHRLRLHAQWQPDRHRQIRLQARLAGAP